MESNPFWLPGDKSMAVAGGLSALCVLQMGGQILDESAIAEEQETQTVV